MKWLKSFSYAFKGLISASKSERNFRIQLACALLVILFGVIFSLSRYEWLAIVLCIGLVLFAELVNTAIEKLLDFVHPGLHAKVGEIKDLSAAAVLVLATSSLIIALIIFIPKVISLWSQT